MFVIQKTVEFSAAHHLPLLPEEHKCHRVHGHNYRIVVTAESQLLDAEGFVVDFGHISRIVRELDHRDLNDFLENPTAEILAEWLYNKLRSLFPSVDFPRVVVYETEDSWAAYLRD